MANEQVFERQESGFHPFQVYGQQETYYVNGADCQILTLTVAPGEVIKTEPGVMTYASPNIRADTECRIRDCTRMLGGEGCIAVRYRNRGSEGGYIGLTPSFPAKVVPVDLAKTSGGFLSRKSAFMASIGQVKVGFSCDKNPCRACCGGMGCCRQYFSGTGTAFLAAGGTILEKTLGPGEKLVVDPSCVLGWQDGVKHTTRFSGCALCCCGGERLFFAVLEGPGLVFLESMSFHKFKRIMQPTTAELAAAQAMATDTSAEDGPDEPDMGPR